MRGLPLLTSLVSIATTFAFVASAAFVGSEQLALSVCVSPFLLLREGAGGVPHHPVLPLPSSPVCHQLRAMPSSDCRRYAIAPHGAHLRL
jgi:hypothetical protein